MSNKKMASVLADRLYSRFVNNAYLKGGNALEGTAETLIEQALNEAEKRGWIEGSDVGWKKGKLFGAEQMRERAADKANELFVGCDERYLYKSSVHEAIRSLRLEGE